MSRRARVFLPNVPVHLIQRGNNRQACFFAHEDYRFYLEWLAEYAGKTGCAIHAYALMTNHVHLLLTAAEAGGAGALMKALGQRYVQYVNRTYRRSGTLWEGRFRSCLTQAETYLLTCQRYIELNPVRAGMVAHPAAYPWSSYRRNAEGAENTLLSPHPVYLAIAGDDDERCRLYRALFRHELEPGVVDSIRAFTNGNFVLGDSRFSGEIAQVLKRRVIPGKAGRPPKAPSTPDVGLF